MQMADDAIVARNYQLRLEGLNSLTQRIARCGGSITKCPIGRTHPVDRMTVNRDRAYRAACLAKGDGQAGHIRP